MKQIIFEESPVSKFLFSNTKSSWFWLVVRLYVGYEWLIAGIAKVGNPAWTGSESGAAIAGFVNGALQKTSGLHPDVQGWYAFFLQEAVLPYTSTWAYAVAYGEVLVGAALILGIFTGIAAFFGLFMNMNYLLAGTVSTNPILFTLSIGLMLGWKVAGFIGLDRFILPELGTPWHRGSFFTGKKIGRLIIARHNESEWNKENRWTGKMDIGLSNEGFELSRKMGELIKDVNIDEAFASAQFRTLATLLCMENNTCLDIPIERSAALNERDYGDYTGKDKSQVEKELGAEAALRLRRGWNESVPNGETLKMVYERVVPFYKETILPKLRNGKTVLLVSHGNTLRALMKYLEDISDEGISNVEMPFGTVYSYEVDTEGRMVRKETRTVHSKKR